jgi:hypothetical protein
LIARSMIMTGGRHPEFIGLVSAESYTRKILACTNMADDCLYLQREIRPYCSGGSKPALCCTQQECAKHHAAARRQCSEHNVAAGNNRLGNQPRDWSKRKGYHSRPRSYVKGRIVDLSPSTARKIGIDSKEGVAKVDVAPVDVPLAR